MCSRNLPPISPPSHDVGLAFTLSSDEVALQVSRAHSQGTALALVASDKRVVAVCVGHALITPLPSHQGRADALTFEVSGRHTVFCTY